MNSKDKQLIGIITENGEANGKENVIINSNSAIQYFVKSLTSNTGVDDFFTGYMSSFEEDVDYDDEYLGEEERKDKFRDNIYDQLFVYNFKLSEGQFLKMTKVNVVAKPAKFDKSDLFNPVPVFSASDDETVTEWEKDKRWKLFRDYKSFEEFQEAVENQKTLGSIYGFDANVSAPSFIIWKDKEERLYAIGKISGFRYNSLGGLILESNNLYKIDISDYLKFIVYHIYINPTLAFIPDSIYKTIEDRLLSEEFASEKEKGANVFGDDKEEEYRITAANQFEEIVANDSRITANSGIKEISAPSSEELEEIDTSERTDEIIIKSMDYHSQRRNLFYSIKDFVNVHTAVKCSNLVILSGLSGTGKSALVEVYARALGINPNASDNRLIFIPVRPSWNDDSDLLGYVDLVHNVYRPSDTGFVDFLVNAQKDEKKDKMYIVCFDEMNLARVEHYFSQFLSILERPVGQRELQLYDSQYTGRLYNSKDYPSSISIGENIRFFGTVNIDESTYHFSDKVLDRANVIELDILNYSEKWVRKQYASMSNINWTKDEYDALIVKNVDVKMDDIQALLWDIHTLLQSASTKYGVGPRIVKSIKMYLNNLPKTEIEGFNAKIGLDYQIKQRVLTKVRGPEIQIGNLLSDTAEGNFYEIFEKYSHLSDFEQCKSVIRQKQKELEAYGYCI